MAKTVSLHHVRSVMPAFFMDMDDAYMKSFFRYCPCCGREVEAPKAKARLCASEHYDTTLCFVCDDKCGESRR